MSQNARSWREVSQMLQGLMQEAEDSTFAPIPPLDAPLHRGATVLQERPPPESGSALLPPP